MATTVKVSKNGGTTIVETKIDGTAQEILYFNQETDLVLANDALRLCHSSGAKVVITWDKLENKLSQANWNAYLAHIVSNSVGFFNPNIVVASIIE